MSESYTEEQIRAVAQRLSLPSAEVDKVMNILKQPPEVFLNFHTNAGAGTTTVNGKVLRTADLASIFPNGFVPQGDYKLESTVPAVKSTGW